MLVEAEMVQNPLTLLLSVLIKMSRKKELCNTLGSPDINPWLSPAVWSRPSTVVLISVRRWGA